MRRATVPLSFGVTIFDRIEAGDHEQVVFCHDRPTGLRAIVAIHSTVLGPSLGGTRFYPYPSEDAALADVLRLAEGMTYKAAVAGLDQGGGKGVIIGDPATDRTDDLIRAYGRFVGALAGRYLTAEDVGTTQADMDLIREVTPYVTGTSEALGGSGDPSAATAMGLYWAMKALLFLSSGTDALGGTHVVVAGVGKVGSHLVRHLVEEGARVTIADIKPQAVDRVRAGFDVEVAAVDDAHRVPCDIYSPCALGGGLDASTIPELRCWAVAKVLDKTEEDLSSLHLHDRHTELRLTDDDLVGMYRSILLARRLDQKIWGLNRMGKAAFVVSCQGHEGAQVGSAWAIRAGHDVVLPYYRDTGVVLALGLTPYDVLLGVFARADEQGSGRPQL